jgi:hypothetical protein
MSSYMQIIPKTCYVLIGLDISREGRIVKNAGYNLVEFEHLGKCLGGNEWQVKIIRLKACKNRIMKSTYYWEQFIWYIQEKPAKNIYILYYS